MNLAARRRFLAEIIEREDDRDQGVNHNIPAILLRDAEEMDRDFGRIHKLEAELAAAEKTIALQDRILAIRESYESGEIISLQDRRAQELREERDKCRAALKKLVTQGNHLIGLSLPFEYALVEAEELLCPGQWREKK